MVVADQITAVVAAGGRSTRFGTDKATYVFEGQRMVDRLAGIAGPVSKRVMVGLPPTEHSHPAGWSQLSEEYTIVRDHPAGIGPMGCLRASLSRADTPWILLVACDLPSLGTDHLQLLLDAARDDTAAVVAVGSEGFPEPLCALYHRLIAPRIEAAVAKKNYAMHRVLSSPDIIRVRLPDSALSNMNFRDCPD
ncbi:molybdenum cofactor guanylyltransferase [Rhodothermus sp. AH-315-K08]|nr:molybdenum cofactor guanylyltransferase [Rhodothermus sp. AH-315-K08]